MSANSGSTPEKKKEALRTLGYEADAVKGKFQLDLGDHVAFGDLFLGLRSEVVVKNLEVLETRFGITMPKSFSEKAKLSIDAVPFENGTISFVGNGEDDPILFFCKAFRTPPGPDRRILFKGNFFDVLIDLGTQGASLSFQIRLDDKEGTSEEWLSYWQAMKILQSRCGVVEMRLSSLPQAATVEVNSMAEDVDFGNVDACLETFGSLFKIGRRAGLSPSAKFTFSEVADAFQEIGFVQDLMDGVVDNIKTRLNDAVFDPPTTKSDMLHINNMHVGDTVIAYYLHASSSFHKDDDGIVLTLDDLSLKRLAVVSSLESYQQFIEGTKRKGLIDQVMVGEYLTGPKPIPHIEPDD